MAAQPWYKRYRVYVVRNHTEERECEWCGHWFHEGEAYRDIDDGMYAVCGPYCHGHWIGNIALREFVRRGKDTANVGNDR